MTKWLKDYIIQVENGTQTTDTRYQELLTITEKQLEDAKTQQEKICGFLETGVYTVQMFTQRNEKLQEEIDKMIEDLQNQQGNDNSGEDPDKSEDDPQEQGSNDPKDQESEEQQAQAEQKKQREEMMKNQLKEKQERAAQEREDELSYVEGLEEEYNFMNSEPIW